MVIHFVNSTVCEKLALLPNCVICLKNIIDSNLWHVSKSQSSKTCLSPNLCLKNITCFKMKSTIIKTWNLFICRGLEHSSPAIESFTRSPRHGFQRFSPISKLQINKQLTKETCELLALKFTRIQILNSNLNIWFNIRFVDEREEKDRIVLIGFYGPEKFLRWFPLRKNMFKTKWNLRICNNQNKQRIKRNRKIYFTVLIGGKQSDQKYVIENVRWVTFV